MIKPEYMEPLGTETKDEIAVHNIKLCDEYKNSEGFIFSSIGWLKNDDSRDFQDLEKLLRDNNLDTHLIAKKINLGDIPNNTKIVVPNNNSNNNLENFYVNILLTSCRPKKEAIDELLKYHEDYQSNFEKLKKTGSIFNNEAINDNPDQGISSILACTKKYKFIKYNNKEALGYIIDDLEKKHNSKPIKTKIGSKNGTPVYGLVIDGKIATPICFCKSDGIDEVELLDLRQFTKNPQSMTNQELLN